MLGFVRCVIGAAEFYRIFVVLGILPLVTSNEALSGLLSSSTSKDKSEKCTLATTHCVPIALHLNRTCLGNHLPYKLTAPIPLGEDVTFYSLEFWKALQSIPTCWDKLQFFLCSVYIPECVVIQTSKSIHDDITYSSITHENNQSKPINHSINVISDQEVLNKNMSVDDRPPASSSSSPASTSIHRIVLPEAEMCEAVHKACPLLFSIIHSMSTNHHNRKTNEKLTEINNSGIDQSLSNNDTGSSSSSSSGGTSKQQHHHYHLYPKFLDCSLYTPGCRQNKLTARLFQSNGGGCQSPLVTTSLRRNWIPGIERCSFPCRRPHFDSEHYKLARWITGCAAVICLCTNIFTLFTIRLQLTERLEITLQLSMYIHRLIDSLQLPTFSTDRRKSHLIYNGKSSSLLSTSLKLPMTTVGTSFSTGTKTTTTHTSTTTTTTTTTTSNHNDPVSNPSWRLLHTSLFYMHLFLIFGCFGWLLPLLPTIGEYVACREDGSLRVGEPQISSGKSILCIIDFILLYFSSMAAAIWSNIFDYALLYQMKKINYNLTNQLPHYEHFPTEHHQYKRQQRRRQQQQQQQKQSRVSEHRRQRQHRSRPRRQQQQQQQQQPHKSKHYHTDIEMKHICQAYVTKFSENLLSRKYHKSCEIRFMPKRISDEPSLSEITNSVNLTNEKSSEFEFMNEEQCMPPINDKTITTNTTTTTSDTTYKNIINLSNYDNNITTTTTTTATDTTNNTIHIDNQPSIEPLNVALSCPSSIKSMKQKCKSSCSLSLSSTSSTSSSSSSASASASSASPASASSLTSSSSSLLLLTSQNVKRTDDNVHLLNSNTTTAAIATTTCTTCTTTTSNRNTISKLDNAKNKSREQKLKGLHSTYYFDDNYHKLRPSPSSHHDGLARLESILQQSPTTGSTCLNPHHSHRYNHHRHHHHHHHDHCHRTNHNSYPKYKYGSFTGIPLNSLIDLLLSSSSSYDDQHCINSCIDSSLSYFSLCKPLISQILWIQLFTSDKYLFIHNMNTLPTVNNEKHEKHDVQDNEENGNDENVDDTNNDDVDDDDDDDDRMNGHFLHRKTTANTTATTATTTTCSDLRSLMLKQGVIISSPINNQSINTQPQTTCLHFLALAIPLVFTLIILTAAEIDGNSLSGICSVGLINIWARVGLVLIPFTLCLIIKFYYFIQLIYQFMKLRHKFLLSSFRVDHELAQRLIRCCLFYGIFLIFLLSLWLFSICIHSYVYLNEPVWLESQRRLFLCRIRYRLLGGFEDNEFSAMNTCLNTDLSYESVNTASTSSSSSSSSSPAATTMAAFTQSLNMHSNPLSSIDDDLSSSSNHHKASLQSTSSQSITDMFTMKSSDLQHQPTGHSIQLNHHDSIATSLTAHTYYHQLSMHNEEMFSMPKPSIGPLLLHLLIYFMINLLYNSICLLDPSVKRTWWYLIKKLVFWCRLKKDNFFQQQQQSQHSPYHTSSYSQDYNNHSHDNVVTHTHNETNLDMFNENNHSANFIQSYFKHLIIGFSWWDPGFFTIPTPILTNFDLWEKCTIMFHNTHRKTVKNSPKRNKKQQDFELVKCKFNRFTNNVHDNTTTTTTTTTTTDATKMMNVSSMVNCTENNPSNGCNIIDLNVSNNNNNNNDNPLDQWNDIMNNGQHLLTLLSKLLVLPVNQHHHHHPIDHDNNSNDLLEQTVLNYLQQHRQSMSTSSLPSSLHDDDIHMNNNNANINHSNNDSNPLQNVLLYILHQLYQLSNATNTIPIDYNDDHVSSEHHPNNVIINSTANTTSTTNKSSISSSSSSGGAGVGNPSKNTANTIINQFIQTDDNHCDSEKFAIHQSDLTMATLNAAAVAAYEHYQKQLSDLTTASITQRRSRHKRLLSGRASFRRRYSQSRRLSTNGLFLPNLTASMNLLSKNMNSSSTTCSIKSQSTIEQQQQQPFTTSILTGTEIDKPLTQPITSERRGSFNHLLQAAASMVAAAAAAAAATANAATASTATNNPTMDLIKIAKTNFKSTSSNNSFNSSSRHHRLSQSGLSGLDSISSGGGGGGTASAFGGSQISSTSIRSALTNVDHLSHRHHRHPHHHHHRRRRQTYHTRSSSTSEAPLINHINNNTHTLNELQSNNNTIGVSIIDKYSNPIITTTTTTTSTTTVNPNTNMHSMGSRMSSLHSISCASSSSGAESYNSYRLLINQAGASWRELWRTRMLLMHVLRWAENVTSFMQSNNNNNNIHSNIIAHHELTQSQMSLSNCVDVTANQTNVNCMKTTPAAVAATITTTTTSPLVAAPLNCDDIVNVTSGNNHSFNVTQHQHQQQLPPTFSLNQLDGMTDFNGQLVQLILSLIEQQQQQQQQQQSIHPGTGSQSKLDRSESLLSTSSLNNLPVESSLQTDMNTTITTTTTTTIITSTITATTTTTTTNTSNSSSSVNHFYGQPNPLTTMDPMIAAAFAAATAAATVALQQQQQQQQLRLQQGLHQLSPSNSTSSPATTTGVVAFDTPPVTTTTTTTSTTTINNINDHVKMFDQNIGGTNQMNVVSNQFYHPTMKHWTNESCSFGSMPQDPHHLSSSINSQNVTSQVYNPSNTNHNLPPMTPIKNTPPYLQTPNQWFPQLSSMSNQPIKPINNMRPYYYNYEMQPNYTYRMNIPTDEPHPHHPHQQHQHQHHQCTIAPDLLLDHDQLTRTEAPRHINMIHNKSINCSLTEQHQHLQHHQESVIHPTSSFNSPVNNNMPHIPFLSNSTTFSPGFHSQQPNPVLYSNTCTNPPYIVTGSSYFNKNVQIPTPSLQHTTQKQIIDHEDTVRLLHNPLEQVVPVNNNNNNNDSDAFDSEDDIVSVDEEEEEGDKEEFHEIVDYNNHEKMELDRSRHQSCQQIQPQAHHHHQQQHQQQHTNVFTHNPYENYTNTHEQMIRFHTNNSHKYFIPNFVNPPYHLHHHQHQHHRHTAMESVDAVNATTLNTTPCLPSHHHTLSIYSNKYSTNIISDDGELSSVSQSASQVVPCASSSSSSSSSSGTDSSSSSSSPSLSNSKLLPQSTSYDNADIDPTPCTVGDGGVVVVVTCAQLDHIITNPSALLLSSSSQPMDRHDDVLVVDTHHAQLLSPNKQPQLDETNN
ncbi:unnamed protein product [Schistosoma turkestanicum]|nr:unnamed protein product [Schistosoma turkestanicum]